MPLTHCKKMYIRCTPKRYNTALNLQRCTQCYSDIFLEKSSCTPLQFTFAFTLTGFHLSSHNVVVLHIFSAFMTIKGIHN